ncbi:gp97 [Bacillus phage G]|uniref:Gp97 n=1 Tax=Bacillus phage G TaxID=2884420 RepID=G3MBG0_9CAUD|nr:gp97 [Bacillus phage G]AEO93360.1 gp97 [Bacillus phage G]
MKKYEFKVKGYVIHSTLKEFFPNNKIVYTIDCYSLTGRNWCDSVVTNSIAFRVNWDEYSKIMQANFNCVFKKMKLYYGSYDECKRAIEFSKTLIVMNKLLK